MDFTVFLTTFAALVAICNPFGNAAVFLSITGGEKSMERRAQATKGCIYMLLILLSFFFGGHAIMLFFGLSLEGIRIAGGLVIVKIGFGLLMPSGKEIHTDEEHDEAVRKPDISFSPLAMPLLSGPGAIATVIGLSARSRWQSWAYSQMVMAIFAVVILCWLILINSERLLGFLGVNGAHAFTKIMGFILLCIGVQLGIEGVKGLVLGGG